MDCGLCVHRILIYGGGRLSLQRREVESELTGATPPPHPSSRVARALAYRIKNADLANLAERQHFCGGQVPDLHLY